MKSNQFIIGARSVDVGYYNVKYTLGRPAIQAPIAVESFPSIAPVLKSGVARQMEGFSQPDGCLVNVGGVSYFAGPGAAHRGSGSDSRLVKEDYATTDKYLALLRAAFWHIARAASSCREVVIRNLSLGLPMNTYFDCAEALSVKAMGEHIVGAGGDERRITIENARVIVQPQGAIINFGHSNGGRPLEGVTMVVDPGGGTLDWYLSEKMTPSWERSGAYPKAMLACAYAVADRINAGWREQARIVDRIDRAIRENRPSFTVQGQEIPLAEHRSAVTQVLDEALDQMHATVGSLDDVDHILFTGGGASVFRDHFQKKHPQLKRIIRMDQDPIFSNVRGFQIVAENDLERAR